MNTLPPEPHVEFRQDRYSVKPDITRLDSDRTSAPTVTLVTANYERLQQQKRATIGDSRFFATNKNFEDIRYAVVDNIATLVECEQPAVFAHHTYPRGSSFINQITDEVFVYDHAGSIVPPPHAYSVDAFDVLGTMLQQDIAVMRMINGRDELVAANVRLPSHWTPEEKIGMDFDAVHKHVPKMQRNGNRIVRAMIHGPRGERFAFGVDADDKYTHTDRDQLSSVPVPELHLVYERQTWIGNPALEYTVFFIHKGKRQFSTLTTDELYNVAQWMQSLDAQERTYKRLEHADEIVRSVVSYAEQLEARR